MENSKCLTPVPPSRISDESSRKHRIIPRQSFHRSFYSIIVVLLLSFTTTFSSIFFLVPYIYPYFATKPFGFLLVFFVFIPWRIIFAPYRTSSSSGFWRRVVLRVRERRIKVSLAVTLLILTVLCLYSLVPGAILSFHYECTDYFWLYSLAANDKLLVVVVINKYEENCL